jgi:hypothetical protein
VPGKSIRDDREYAGRGHTRCAEAEGQNAHQEKQHGQHRHQKDPALAKRSAEMFLL